MVPRAWGQREKMGGGEGACGSGAPFPPPIFSPFSPGGAHHSAEAVRRGGTSNSSVCASARQNPLRKTTKHVNKNLNPFPHPSLPAHLTACAFSSYPHHSTKPCAPDGVPFRVKIPDHCSLFIVHCHQAGRRSAGIACFVKICL